MYIRRLFATLIACLACTALTAGCSLPAGSNAQAAPPQIKIISPANGATISNSTIAFEVEVENWKFVDANQPAKAGEDHVHFFIDTPASAVLTGEAIPLDQPSTFVHAGKAPYTRREIKLDPGEHTVVVVMGNSLHQALANPAPVSVAFTVK